MRILRTFCQLALCMSLLLAFCQEPTGAPKVQGQNVNGMHIYIRAGL